MPKIIEVDVKGTVVKLSNGKFGFMVYIIDLETELIAQKTMEKIVQTTAATVQNIFLGEKKNSGS